MMPPAFFYQKGVKMKALIVSILCISLFAATAYADDTSTSINTENSLNMQSTQTDAKNTGEKFLAENKSKAGVVTLADGLQYKIITEGTGPRPTISDNVTVNYAGKLINGTEFDSSYKRGQPATFPVTGVIPGWVEALQLMTVGSVWELYIPASLAYGERGAPPVIGPNETLIFKVELLGINK